MSQHPPRHRVVAHQTSAASIDHELLQEKASALGRQGRRLEATLQSLANFDSAAPCHSPIRAGHSAREALVAAAAAALWNLVVQREACGFSNGQAVLDDYKVPADVHRRAGIGPLTRPRMRRSRG
jgi:hypothetical protein